MIYTIRIENTSNLPSPTKEIKQVEVDPQVLKVPIQTNLYQTDFPDLWNLLENVSLQEQSETDKLIQNELILRQEKIIQTNHSSSNQIDIREFQLIRQFQPELLNLALGPAGPLTIKYGKHNCFCTEGQFLIVGTQIGCVYAVDLSQNQVRKGWSAVSVFNNQDNEEIILTQELCFTNNNYGQVCQVSQCQYKDEHLIGASFEKGALLFLDLNKPSRLKWNKESHQSKVGLLQNISRFIWVSCDEQGNIFLHKLEKGIFSLDLESQLLFTNPITSVAALTDLRHFPESRSKNLIKYDDLKLNKVNKEKDEPYVLFAMCNQFKCWIVRMLESSLSSVQILGDVVNNEESRNQAVVQWAWNSNSLYLLISWSNKIVYYKLQKMKSDTSMDLVFQRQNVLEVEKNICFMRCLFPNVIYSVDTEGGVSIYSLLANRSKHIFDIQTNGKFLIDVNVGLKELFLMNDSSLVIVKEYDFTELFNNLVERRQLFHAKQLLIIAKSVEIDKVKIEEKLVELVTVLLQGIIRLNLQKKLDEAQQEFIELMSFIILLQADEILYGHVYKTVSSYFNDNGKFFLECLENFISTGQLTFIPDQQFLQIVNKLLQQNKMALLSQLFMSINLERANQSLIFQVCNEHFLIYKYLINRLKRPLMYLCTHSSKNEMLTPLFQIWSFMQAAISKNQMKNAQRYGRNALAYILFTLSGFKVNMEPIPQAVYLNTVEMMLVWVFEPSNLQQLVSIEPQGAFDMIFKLFELTTQYLIEFTHKDNLQLLHDTVKPNLDRSLKSQFTSIVDQEFLNPSENYKVEKYYSLFLLRIQFKLRLQFDFDTQIQLLLFLTNNVTVLFEVDRNVIFECLDKFDLDYLMKSSYSCDMIDYIHQCIVLKVIKQAERFQDSSIERQESQLNQLSSISAINEFDLVQGYLYSRKQDYERAFNILLKSSNKIIKHSTFKWLWDTLQKLEGTLYFKQLNQQIISRMTDLIKMDLERTRSLVQKYQKNCEQQVIEKLSTYPQLQLDYIDYLIKTEKKKNMKVDNNFLKEHISLLMKLQPDRVLEELKKNDYPLDDVLKISQSNNHQEAQAFVLERTGSIFEAIMIHINLLKGLLEHAIQQITQYEEVPQSQYTFIELKIQEILDICIKNSNFDNSEDNWYTFLDLFVDFIENKLDKKDIKQQFVIKQMSRKLGYIMEEISLYTSPDIFATSLEERYGQLEIGELKYTFIKILNNFYYQKNFLLNIQNFIRDGFTKDSSKIYLRRKQGYFIGSSCSFCNEPLVETDVIVFYCGHALHNSCNSDQQKCKRCQECDFGIYDKILQNKQQRMRRLIDKEDERQRGVSFNKEVVDKRTLQKLKPHVDKTILRLQRFDQQIVEKCDRRMEMKNIVCKN